MSDWFYARGGKQSGPVPFEQLATLARMGDLDPVRDLVWTSTMKDWTPAGQVDGLFSAVTAPLDQPAADPANPYSAPQSSWNEAAPSPGAGLPEIIHGSEPIDAPACIKRGFNLTARQFGMIFIVGLVYFVVTMVAGVLLDALDSGLGLAGTSQFQNSPENPGSPGPIGAFAVNFTKNGSFLNIIITQVLSTFLSLGVARIGLNLVSGKEVSVAMLFGEGRKLLRAIGASILFGVLVVVGLLLLIVPGIYFALRYGQYMMAIVDRDLGVFEAFSYSSSITTNNRLLLFVLWLLSILVMLAGFIACGVGLIFAIPVVWLASAVAYRWMQYGHRAALDHPGTVTPMLTGV